MMYILNVEVELAISSLFEQRHKDYRYILNDRTLS